MSVLKEHPGGATVILKYAGKDATSAYGPIHPSDALEKNLSPSQHLGPVSNDAASALAQDKGAKKPTKDELRVTKALKQRPPLNRIINLADMEQVASKVLSYKAWAYYRSAADDEITVRENHAAYHRIWFRPRVLRNVTEVDFSTKILGHKSSMPIYIVSILSACCSSRRSIVYNRLLPH